MENIKTYEEYVNLLVKNQNLLEKFDENIALAGSFTQSQNSEKAVEKYREAQDNLRSLKLNAIEINKLGIQEISQNSLKSFDLLIEAYNHKIHSVGLVQDKLNTFNSIQSVGKSPDEFPDDLDEITKMVEDQKNKFEERRRQSEELMKSYNEFVRLKTEAVDLDDSTLTDSLGEIEVWFEESIGKCSGYFREYN